MALMHILLVNVLQGPKTHTQVPWRLTDISTCRSRALRALQTNSIDSQVCMNRTARLIIRTTSDDAAPAQGHWSEC